MIHFAAIILGKNVLLHRGLQLGISLCLAMSCGCVRPWNTELPSVQNGSPYYEQQRIQRFDPFASTELGPSTMSRPRGYEESPNITRSTQESGAYSAPVVPGTVHPQFAPPAAYPQQQYPGVVPLN